MFLFATDCVVDIFGEEDESWRQAEEDEDEEVKCKEAAPAAASSVLGAAILMCLICGQNPRANNQIYCNVPCAADVKAGQRDAKSQGKASFDAWKKIRRQGGAPFAEAVQVYKSKCAGFGRGFRRPSFAWVRYWMAIQFASRVQTGTKSLWLTRGAYIAQKKVDEEVTEQQAAMMWAQELEILPKARISQDRKKYLCPHRAFCHSNE